MSKTRRIISGVMAVLTAATLSMGAMPMAAGAAGEETRYDVNGDGRVDLTDASEILSAYSLAASGKQVSSVYDVDGNGKVELTDATLVMSYYSSHAATVQKVGSFENTMIGARVWSTYNGSLNMRASASGSSALVAKIPQGQKMTVSGDISNDYVKVTTNLNGTSYTGYVYSKYIMINLPDIMPSLEYNITNADSCIYTCAGYDIPNVSRTVLYPNTKYTESNGAVKYYVPLRYDTALKLNTAYQAAKAEGYNLKIYDAYRPYSVTQLTYQKFSAVANANDTRGKAMKAAMNQNGLGISWFLAAGKSAHNYGIALDLTLTKNGKEIQAQSAMHCLDASSAISKNNDETKRLQRYMTSAGFSTLQSEWWHFQDGSKDSQYVSNNYCNFFAN